MAALVLLTLASVPSLARAHDRLDEQRTPAQEHSRFRWTNSCESISQKIDTIVAVAPLVAPMQTRVDRPTRAWQIAPPDGPGRALRSPARSARGLRAPPPAA